MLQDVPISHSCGNHLHLMNRCISYSSCAYLEQCSHRFPIHYEWIATIWIPAAYPTPWQGQNLRCGPPRINAWLGVSLLAAANSSKSISNIQRFLTSKSISNILSPFLTFLTLKGRPHVRSLLAVRKWAWPTCKPPLQGRSWLY
jgi:hypothetical protein